LAFLDILLNKTNNKLKTSIFRKSTFTGVLTNFFSFTSFSYKLGLINTLLDRAYKINNTSSGLDNDFADIKNILMRNNYPAELITKSANINLQMSK